MVRLTAAPRRRAERLYHRIAAIATVALLGILLWDDLANGSRLFVPLLVILGSHLVAQLTVLLWLRPETEARIEQEIGQLVQSAPPAAAASGTPAEADPPAPEAPFVFDGYTLHRTKTMDRGGNPRTFYFFSKRSPSNGTPTPKPPGHYVGVNPRTGLPFLKRGLGTDGAALTGGREAKVEQCQAITAQGAQCKFTGRPRSKYCGRHHAYRPPSKAVAAEAQDTKPLRRKAIDTKPSRRSA